MENELVCYMVRKLLDLRFSSVKEMALAIGVSYRALLRTLHYKNSTQDTQTVMNAIAAYCMKEQILPETMFKGFSPV